MCELVCVNFISKTCLCFFCLTERGKGHDCQNEPAEDQLCHPQQWTLDRPSLLQPFRWKSDLQRFEEDGKTRFFKQMFIDRLKAF